jgi:hypothetical protein
MEAMTLAEFPFFNVIDTDLNAMICKDAWSSIFDKSQLSDYFRNLRNSEIFRQTKLNYVTEDQFNSCFGSNKHVELSIFHTNIRSLNSKHSQLCQLLELLVLDFDVYCIK